ncbi:MAG: pantetheine-phosphate adenylyltransferase [Leadbetterella sp.]
MKKKIAFFPGSFDPFTLGHFDIVSRGLEIFDEIIIGIGTNSNKKRYFEIEHIKKGINTAFENDPRIRTIEYQELTATAAKKAEASVILRGLRNTTDLEYENTIAQVNKRLDAKMETLFLITSPIYATISSTVVRELHRFGEDISEYLPYKLS